MSSLNRLVRQATRIASSRGGAGRPGGRHGTPRGGAHGRPHGGGSPGSRLGAQVGRMIEGRLGGKGRRRF